MRELPRRGAIERSNSSTFQGEVARAAGRRGFAARDGKAWMMISVDYSDSVEINPGSTPSCLQSPSATFPRKCIAP